ncbi:MAG: acriflavin resistance protein [Rhodothalassiaceae bacterium]|nr:MAG: acriflavin resistance protein [Rhodothalassiaceae bacterium]
MIGLYRYPRLIILLLLLILVAGSASIRTMPRLEDPHMKQRYVFVLTPWPGADASQVESRITIPIEEKLREVAEVKDIVAVSRLGLSFISVEMKDEVEDVDLVASRLKDKLAEVTDLPEGAGPPRFDDKRLYAFTTIIALTWRAEGPPNYAILGRYAKELKTRLANLPGTDFARIFGLPQEEIVVSFDPDRLAAAGLSLAEAVAALKRANREDAVGLLAGEAHRFVLTVSGRFADLDRIRRVPLTVEPGTGRRLTVGDLGTVRRGIEDPPGALALIDGRPGVAVAARMLQDQRIDHWMARVHELMDDFSARLPHAVGIGMIFDQSHYTNQRLAGLMENLVYSALIVLTVLLITLGWRASLISASILPLAALASLALLDAMGFAIEQMVVTGLIIALGIMVDNAIVVTDEVQSRLLRGERRSLAVMHTVKKLWLPLLGSTVTTIIAFLPIILMPGNAGEFVGGISGSVIAALTASYVISFTIIVALAGRVLGRKGITPPPGAPEEAIRILPRPPERRWWREGVAAKPVQRLFRRSLVLAMRHPWATILIVGIVPLSGLALTTTLTEQFFPPSDRDQLVIEVNMPPGTAIGRTRQVVEELRALLATRPEVVSNHWFIGQSAPKFFYSMLTNKDGEAQFAEGMVNTHSEEEVDRLIAELQPLVDARFPEAQILVRKLEQGPPYEAPIEIRLLGPDLETLRLLGEEVARHVAAVPEVQHVRTSLKGGQPETLVEVDEAAARDMGLDLKAIAEMLGAAVEGAAAGSVTEETETVPVRVRASAAHRRSIDALAALDLPAAGDPSATGGGAATMPLAALAEVRLAPKVTAIVRRNGERVNTVQAFIPPDVLPETVFAKVRRRLADAGFVLPPGYHIEIGGESEKRNEAVAKLMAKAGVLAVLMVIAILLTFNSFRLTFITFMSAAQAAALGLLSLWVFGYPLGFLVIVGLMGLVGLAINASIVILSELKNRPLAAAGEERAIVHGVMATGRHVVSTTLTTVGGFLPLILSKSPFWPPFAAAIAGGTLLTMFVSFYFAPAAFRIAVRNRALADPGRRRPAADAAAAAAERPLKEVLPPAAE